MFYPFDTPFSSLGGLESRGEAGLNSARICLRIALFDLFVSSQRGLSAGCYYIAFTQSKRERHSLNR